MPQAATDLPETKIELNRGVELDVFAGALVCLRTQPGILAHDNKAFEGLHVVGAVGKSVHKYHLYTQPQSCQINTKISAGYALNKHFYKVS